MTGEPRPRSAPVDPLFPDARAAENVPLGFEHSRVVHGAPGTVLDYADGFRSAVYKIPARLGRGNASTMLVPFLSILVVISGCMTGSVGENPFSIGVGTRLYIRPSIPARLWNDQDRRRMMMFLMSGDGA